MRVKQTNQCLIGLSKLSHPLLSHTVGLVVWVTGFSAGTAHERRVYTGDNEAGCYHVTVAQDYGYVISL